MKSLAEWCKSQNKRRNTNKGNAFEQSIAENLRRDGWIVDVTELNRTVRRGRWITKKGDFFGQFDIIALKHGNNSVLFIQATTDRGGVSKKKRGIDEAIGIPSRGREYIVVTKPIDKENSFEIYRRVEHGWTPGFCVVDIDIGWRID